jgi:hypothetical protein
MRPRCHPLVFVALTGLLALVWLNGADGPEADRDAMVGTWTDEAGPPGNSVRFYFVAQAIPGIPEATAYEGHVTLVNFLGQAQANGSWGYGSWNPLTLNVSAGGKDWFVAIRKLDDDHLLVRFGIDPEEMYRPEALDHLDARVLTRTGWEPDGPFNRGPR